MLPIPFLNCPSCGKHISNSDHLCPHCGLDLDAPLEAAELQALAQVCLDKAASLLESGFNLKTALSYCDEAIEYLPTSADAHNLRGLVLDALGRDADAILAYREALRLDPGFVDARENLDNATLEHPNLDEFVMENEGKRPVAGWIRSLLIMTAGVIFLFACIGVATLAFNVGKQLLVPKKAITFSPDRSLVKDIRPDDLQKTAKILQDRWKALDDGYATFTVSDDGTIIGQLPADTTENQINRIKVYGLVEFVNTGKTRPNTGDLINTDFPSPYFTTSANDPKWQTIMTNSEIETASLEADGYGGLQIAFILTASGSKILADFSSKHIGDILAITLDKKVISAPSINGAITGGSGVITGQFSKEEARDLVALLQTQPLPIPFK